jgi:hypothetical protein
LSYYVSTIDADAHSHEGTRSRQTVSVRLPRLYIRKHFACGRLNGAGQVRETNKSFQKVPQITFNVSSTIYRKMFTQFAHERKVEVTVLRNLCVCLTTLSQ